MSACNCGMPNHLSWCSSKRKQETGLVLQKQPSKWSCMPAAFAMVMGVPVADVIDDIGRDDERGFHPQELAHVALERGWAFVEFDAEPKLEPMRCSCGASASCQNCKGSGVRADDITVPLVRNLMLEHDGVLLGQRHGKDHAVAWCKTRQKVLDPAFLIYESHDFNIEMFFVGVRIALGGRARPAS